MIPKARIAHSVPGRVRFRVPAMRRKSDYFAQVEQVLGQCPDVESYRVEARTGSILVNYQPDADVSEITAYAEQANLFQLSKRTESEVTVLGRAMGQVAQWDDRLRDISHGHANLRILFIVILLGFGVTQILRGRSRSIASIMLWYAFDLARAELDSHREEKDNASEAVEATETSEATNSTETTDATGTAGTTELPRSRGAAGSR